MSRIVKYLVDKFIEAKIINVTEDGFSIDLTHRIYIAMASAAACLVYYFFCSILFINLSRTYKNLCQKDKMFWSLAFVRGTYGLIGALLSAYSLYFETDQYVHIIESKTMLSSILIPCHFGFFVFEWSAQTMFDIRFKTLSTALHVHHFIAFVGYSMSTVNQLSHWTALRSFTLELSTPFSCVCYCLIKGRMQDSVIWKMNQFVLVHTFHVRSMIEFAMIYETITQWDKFLQMPIVMLADNLVGLVAVTFFLTPYWTYKKTQQLFLKEDWNDSTKPQKAIKKKAN